MADCSAVVASRSAQVASTGSPFGLTHADTAAGSRLFHARAPRSHAVDRVRLIGAELTTATAAEIREDLEEEEAV